MIFSMCYEHQSTWVYKVIIRYCTQVCIAHPANVLLLCMYARVESPVEVAHGLHCLLCVSVLVRTYRDASICEVGLVLGLRKE